MGTRSLTKVIETWTDDETKKKRKQKIITMYRQYDGYPSGMGQDLSEFIGDGKLVNGIGMAEKTKIFNGAGCFAAQLVAHFKEEAGGIYLYPTSATDCGQDYEYEILCDFNKEITIIVYKSGYINKAGAYINKKRKMFKGTPPNFKIWLENQDD